MPENNYPKWTLTSGETQCSKCKTLVEQTWRCYVEQSIWIHEWCLDCVQDALAKGDELKYNVSTHERI